MKKNKFRVLEICAGAGGQAIGIEEAGFEMAGAIEIDHAACATLRLNRPFWNVVEADLRTIRGGDFEGVDLLAGGVPCPPFSIAGMQLGENDERDMFPEALRLVSEIRPKAVMLENVRGFANGKFGAYRSNLFSKLSALGYKVAWQILNAADFGVPQLRPRFILVALQKEFEDFFQWPSPKEKTVTVVNAIKDLMLSAGWKYSKLWIQSANAIAPTLVGGSKKHGGADLGPSRAKRQWGQIGIDGHGLADTPPGKDFPRNKPPRLTLRMAARIQGFPDSWNFSGRKTAIYRQIGNAFPPPVAAAVGKSIMMALLKTKRRFAQKGQQNIFGQFELISSNFPSSSGLHIHPMPQEASAQLD